METLTKMLAVLAFCLFACLFLRVSLYIPGWPATSYVDQIGLELIQILLPLPPECAIKRVNHYSAFLFWHKYEISHVGSHVCNAVLGGCKALGCET
ncbi:rCG63058 [Rattus norvegicus]|uniref:RCG63058 n=1 Tax=Rattus norvegicus TaxID=10116 RepID=A6KUI8_RAT|nr:rCG63058 [Rattus norvegicus]